MSVSPNPTLTGTRSPTRLESLVLGTLQVRPWALWETEGIRGRGRLSVFEI